MSSGHNERKAELFGGPKPVSLKVLAEHLGLSRGTVSIVLNSSPGFEAIPAHTRKRIIDAAREHNYKPNYFARALSLKRSFLIGILTTSLAEGYDSSLLGAIERHLMDTDYVYFVASHLWSRQLLRRSMETLLERGAEGIILINAKPPEMRIDVPVVTIGAGTASPGMSGISIDNALGAGLVLRHLYDLGHRKIAYLMGPEDGSDTQERWDGIVQMAQSLSLPINPEWTFALERLEQFGLSGIEQGAAATEMVLGRSGDFTAIVCFNDMSAIGAIKALRARRIAVPAEISVVGFDDIQLANAINPALTTVRQPLLEMGQLAASRIVDQIEKGIRSVETTLMIPELVVRQSSGPVRSS